MPFRVCISQFCQLKIPFRGDSLRTDLNAVSDVWCDALVRGTARSSSSFCCLWRRPRVLRIPFNGRQSLVFRHFRTVHDLFTRTSQKTLESLVADAPAVHKAGRTVSRIGITFNYAHFRIIPAGNDDALWLSLWHHAIVVEHSEEVE